MNKQVESYHFIISNNGRQVTRIEFDLVEVYDGDWILKFKNISYLSEISFETRKKRRREAVWIAKGLFLMRKYPEHSFHVPYQMENETRFNLVKSKDLFKMETVYVCE